ncbi:MAG TPA: SEC-C metal-binding domain-containing protein [Kofleriaceae bacterium]|jgi:preprotein translocase subunit SecA|nr:SEC-C metal-binding domain-containing protein [Kofleriaceae bacterium]
MSAAHVVTADEVERTILAFTRLDQRGDKKAMNRLAQRLQKEQPFLLQHAAATKNEHGDTVGEAAVFYATLMWAMFDRRREGTLPRLTAQNLAAADEYVTQALLTVPNLAELPAHERVARVLREAQPHIYDRLIALLAEDVKEAAMTADTAATIIKPTEVVIEAFDAALSGRRPGEQQGTLVNDSKVGRNEQCPCGSGKKYKKCHGLLA